MQLVPMRIRSERTFSRTHFSAGKSGRKESSPGGTTQSSRTLFRGWACCGVLDFRMLGKQFVERRVDEPSAFGDTFPVGRFNPDLFRSGYPERNPAGASG